jgi:predicted ATPase/DNA-binding SARP family transcriptional activator
MAALKLSLLGPPRIELDGGSITIQRRRATALLAYLAVTGERQPRDSLAVLFWPESGHHRARAALRRDLSELNLALKGQWLDVNQESIGLQAGYWLDVAEFERRLAQGVEALMAAANLYRGDFLAGFTLPDAPPFDEWQFFQGERLRTTLAAVLERLVGTLSDQGHYEQAIPYARRWLALDTAHEPAARQLMLLYARAGQQGPALRQYELFHQTLQAEFGVSPSAETTALYTEIRAGRLRAVGPPALPRRGNLPTQTTTFIGRYTELAEIKRLLRFEPGCRLLNLVGPGGIGKTRLALAAAAELIDAFPDGAYLVALAPVGEAVDVVPAIADALRFQFFGDMEPKQQLLDYLGPQKLLLVVDNFEHLPEEAGLLTQILGHAPNVTILATSRERLHLQEEWVYDVHGLAFPTHDEALRDSGEYSALELFTQRARQAVAKYAPSPAELAEMARICQLVEGMPLALELAAPWTRTLGCREIADEIQRSLDFLTTTARNVPERHRSIGAVFEQTWGRLADQERLVLQRLAVFRGGCTRLAAEQVTGATLPVLSSLVDKALLRRTNTGRYELHELIRQFAESQLQVDPRVADEARRRHRAFFMGFLATRTTGAKGFKQPDTLAEIEADIDNVRLAWRGAAANREAAAIERAAECLFVYCLYRNGYDEGILEFGRALAAFTAPPHGLDDDGWAAEPVVPAQDVALVGFLLAGLGYFLAHRRDLQKGQIVLERALALLRRATPGDRRKLAFALTWLGWAHYFRGQTGEGKQYAQESLALHAETGDRWGEGWALLLLGNCLREGSPAEAAEVYQTGVTLCRKSGDQIVLSYLSLNLGVAAKELGRYAHAQQSIDLAVTISEKLGNLLGLGYSLFSRGRLEIAQGKYGQAIRTLQQALTYFNKVGTVHASRAQTYLGLAHHLQGDFDRAAQLYGQALAGFHAANSKLEYSRCLNGLGCLAYDQGKLHQAEQLQRESLALLHATEPDSALVAVTLRYLGQVMLAFGEERHTEARRCFRHALALAVERQLAPLALDVCADVAQLMAQEAERARAVKLLRLVAQHGASSFATRMTARTALRGLVEQTHPQATAPDQEQMPELWATAQRLLDELAAADA